MGDGAIKFVTDSIESGNQEAHMVEFSRTGISAPGSQSPYGLWGALGTRASKETVGEFGRGQNVRGFIDQVAGEMRYSASIFPRATIGCTRRRFLL